MAKRLQVSDCFILCDAGGGTVDVVSYQVKKVTPHLELERATEPRSKFDIGQRASLA